MTFLMGRTASRPKLPAFLILSALAVMVAGCGVKNDLVKPNGQPTPKTEHDPSKPPYPLGR